MINALKPLALNEWNLPVVDPSTMQSSYASVWCGGDVAGVAETTVESVNDGKTAAWYIHCALEVSYGEHATAYFVIINKYMLGGYLK